MRSAVVTAGSAVFVVPWSAAAAMRTPSVLANAATVAVRGAGGAASMRPPVVTAGGAAHIEVTQAPVVGAYIGTSPVTRFYLGTIQIWP
jgi:hypothetical protein